MTVGTALKRPTSDGRREIVESVVIRFAGDSGDGMQLAGSHFMHSTALMGNDLATFPDFPAEIRAPAGSTYGVSAFQINFAAHDILTAGDQPDVLVAMNPAALKVNIDDLKTSGLVVINTGAFSASNLRKAGYEDSPLADGTLAQYRVLSLDISKLTLQAVKDIDLSNKDALRCKNMWTLGLMLWLYGRDRTTIVDWLNEKFAGRPEIAEGNIAALNAGHIYGETAEMPSEASHVYSVPQADSAAGVYRTVTGSDAVAWGLVAGAGLAGLNIMFGSYPITPASSILHTLAHLKQYGVVTFQAEDEIAAVCAAIGASYAGSLGVTSSSGPGIALKMEAIGLAVATELPLVVVNSQRGGPATGLPTKAEQSDLFQALFGRNGDCPLPVIAAATPSDCFDVAIETVRLATKYMTPVMLMTDGYLANAAEPWRVPDIHDYTPFPVSFHGDADTYQPYGRDPETLARPWAKPGTPGLEHRLVGLERDARDGTISYDADNHQRMTDLRAAKIDGIAKDIPLQEVALGGKGGRLVVVGWGSTYGPIQQAVDRARKTGRDVSHIHIRHIHPLPRNLGDLLRGFDRVVVAEMNTGQMLTVLRAEYLVPAEGLNKVSGKPFKVSEIEDAIHARLELVT